MRKIDVENFNADKRAPLFPNRITVSTAIVNGVYLRYCAHNIHARSLSDRHVHSVKRGRPIPSLVCLHAKVAHVLLF